MYLVARLLGMTEATPGLRAHEASMRLDVSELVGELRLLLGAKLVAYLGLVSETRTVRQWADGERTPPTEVIRRLRLAYEVAVFLAERDSPGVVQAWFQGMNPQLGDQGPASLMRENSPDDVGIRVLAAARSFYGSG